MADEEPNFPQLVFSNEGGLFGNAAWYEPPVMPAVQQLCNQVMIQAEQEAGMKFPVFTAKAFITQDANGTNYYIKVNVGSDQYVHLKVHKNTPQSGSFVQLDGVQLHKTLTDPLVYF